MPYEYPPAAPDTDSSEESGGAHSALGEEGPTECDCKPGEPGFAGFAGPKVPTQYITSLSLYRHDTQLFVLLALIMAH